MISVEEALKIVQQHKMDFGQEHVALSDSLNRVLAGDIFADRDFPPCHRVTMDGIAINSKTFENGVRSFLIEKVQPAGVQQQPLEDVLNCIEVMTGAVLPENTDVVVPYEDLIVDGGRALIKTDTVKHFQNVHSKGADRRAGDILLSKGTRIGPAHIGVLAAAGISDVPVMRMPSVAVCSTGDELVDVGTAPGDHQVRKSNVYMIVAALKTEGISAEAFHFPDDREALSKGIRRLLKTFDVLLFSGAVSKGKYDYLPGVLNELGMITLFHRVAQKPGKPFLFGGFSRGTKIFGFPGNPVSTFICYHLYFRNWLYTSLGLAFPVQRVLLAEPVDFSPELSYHMLVSLNNADSIIQANPVTGSGSGDLPGLTAADGFVSLPPGRERFERGELFDMIPFRSNEGSF